MTDPSAVGAEPAPATDTSSHRILTLDGVRGIAILLVVQLHYWNLPFGLGGYKTTNDLDEWTGKVVGVGWSGVDLFFVLSGFLITGILYDAKAGRGYFRNFYARRLLRIFPIYAVFLLFVLFVLPIPSFFNATEQLAQVSDLRDIQFWLWTYLVNIGSSVDRFDVEVPLIHAHFWSLAVEEQFYLVWPFVVLAFGRRTLMAICGSMIVAAFVIRFVLTAGVASDFFGVNSAYVLMPARMDTLAIGALIALVYGGGDVHLLRRFAPAVMVVSAIALVGIFIRNGGLDSGAHDVQRYGFTFVALLFGGFLLYAIEAEPGGILHRSLTNPVLRTFGRYSYAIYVVHLLLGFEIARHFVINRWSQPIAGSHIPVNIVFSVVATAAVLEIAWISWHVIEQPFLRLKSHFTYVAAKPGS